MTKVVYIISDIDKALAFEWIATLTDKERFRLSFVLLNPGPSFLENFLRDRDIPVHRIPCASKKDWPKAGLSLTLFLRKERPDVVHCHLFTANLLGLTAAKLVGIKQRIYTRHHSDFHYRYFPSGVKWDKWANRMATDIVAPSKVVADILINREGVPPRKVHLVHHGFDLDYFDSVSAEERMLMQSLYNPERKAPVVGVIARFTKLKGIQFIIPAFQQLLTRYPNARLLLFNARGDYETEINKLLHLLPAGSYQCIAFENRLAAVYTLFDVFVQASTDREIEAFGQTYVEALAAGVPSIFTMAGVASEFIRDGHNAVVVDFEDSNQIYQALCHIIEDPSFSQQLRAEGKNTVHEMFGIKKMIRSLEQLYSK